MTKTKFWLSILAISVVLIAGSVAVSPIAIAGDDDDDDDDEDNELSQLVCEAGKAMTGILFEDDDEITNILCGAQLQGPQGPAGADGADGAPGPGLSCENQEAIEAAVLGFVIDPECIPPPPLDSDGDGFSESDGDCNDSDDTVFPGAPELLDGIDNDCDGIIDNPEPVDADGDGFSESDGDCNDSDDTVFPGAPEPLDGIDNDCDGIIDNL